MIAIIGAMEEEIAVLKEMMDGQDTLTRASMVFYHGTINEREVVLVKSGIGKVNAAVCTQILADAYHPDAIINTGIAGSLDNRIAIGDIVLSTDALQHDVDASMFGDPRGQIPNMDTLSFTASEVLRSLARKANADVNPDIHTFEGRILSGDQFISDREIRKELAKNFGGICTEMEGAAVAQAAYLNQIPFLIVRAISDKADDSATEDYSTFKEKAITHSVQLIVKMLQIASENLTNETDRN